MPEPVITVEDLPTGERKVAFEIPGSVCTPDEFAAAAARVSGALSGDRIVVINGRGPVWGYGMLVHDAHATPAVATYDPRLRGYVVVASHDPRYRVGQVVPDPEES
jgi:CRISPR-associated protein Csx3